VSLPDGRGSVSGFRAVTIGKFSLIGIEGRTDNTREIEGQGIIGGLWARFMEGPPRIPNRLDSSTLALYTEYESDEHGSYTFFIGAKVSATTDVPEGMAVREVPEGRYAVFTSEQGPLERIVPAIWQRIWWEARAAGYARSYRTDFELYDTRAADRSNGQIDVYIGLK
jgi:predicted transcriptional regulator YdeE